MAALQRVDKKHASKFAKLTAAADTMRTETEDAAAEQQRRADSLAEAMLRQTNNQQTAYETMRFEVQRTVEQLNQSDFERRADAERLVEQLRQADVQASHDVDAAAESLRRIERERAVNEQRRTEWVRRQDNEYENDVLAARSEMQRIEEAFRRIDIERKALEAAPASAGAAAAVDAAGKWRDPALRGNGDGMVWVPKLVYHV